MARLSDSELAARVRAGNIRRAEQRRRRLAAAGKVQVVTWIPKTTKEALEREATRRGKGLIETLAALLGEALNSGGDKPPGADA